MGCTTTGREELLVGICWLAVKPWSINGVAIDVSGVTRPDAEVASGWTSDRATSIVGWMFTSTVNFTTCEGEGCEVSTH